MRYLMNSAVITASGVYSYRHVSPEEARRWYWEGEMPHSTIGYTETAIALEQLLGVRVEVNRVTVQMQPGDEALVFRLVFPPGTPRISPEEKGRLEEAVRRGWWELGILTRLE